MSAASKIGVSLIFLAGLTSCVNNSAFRGLESAAAPQSTVREAPQIQPIRSGANPDYYLVKPGDTLYSIAFRFGLDYKGLATANGIGSDYLIYEGQSLRLAEAQQASSSRDNSEQTSSNSARNETPVSNSPSSQEIDSEKSTNNQVANTDIRWFWPHNGNIVRTFSQGSSTNKGIDLGGEIGDSVLAAATGVVVYAGNGLPGYGNLIILEHPNSLLSAYAFNERILVAEKDQVDGGQRIATMGSQGDQPGLHFEIRRNGKPVDPLTFLPIR